jgi:hypothetical protein
MRTRPESPFVPCTQEGEIQGHFLPRLVIFEEDFSLMNAVLAVLGWERVEAVGAKPPFLSAGRMVDLSVKLVFVIRGWIEEFSVMSVSLN